MSKLRAGFILAPRKMTSISGDQCRIPDPKQILHLQFRRFAGCPVCNLHLHSFVKRHDELIAAGIREAAFFHSSHDELYVHGAALPFAVFADPDKVTYREFGVESATRALLDPRAWFPILKAVLATFWGVVRDGEPMPTIRPRGGSLGLPADFLIAPDGRVLAAKYGEHANDQWTVDEVLTLVARRRAVAISS